MNVDQPIEITSPSAVFGSLSRLFADLAKDPDCMAAWSLPEEWVKNMPSGIVHLGHQLAEGVRADVRAHSSWPTARSKFMSYANLFAKATMTAWEGGTAVETARAYVRANQSRC